MMIFVLDYVYNVLFLNLILLKGWLKDARIE